MKKRTAIQKKSDMKNGVNRISMTVSAETKKRWQDEIKRSGMTADRFLNELFNIRNNSMNEFAAKIEDRSSVAGYSVYGYGKTKEDAIREAESKAKDSGIAEEHQMLTSYRYDRDLGDYYTYGTN